MGRLPSVERSALRRASSARVLAARVLAARVSAPALAMAALVAACDSASSGAASSRSEQVIATGSMPTTAPSASSDPHAAQPAVRAAPRNLCAGDGNARGRVVPKTAPAQVEAPGAPRLPAGVPLARVGWTWINFWAAWCAPCKEEMPRLLAWQDRLARAGTIVTVAFVSLDDDSRQLEQFLGQQRPDGVKGTYWLGDGPARTAWLSSLKMKSSPELPEHALVDQTGHVRCFIEGAVEESDYAELAALMAH
jgi:thiol-disulfide isomerase/thioredoxin